MKANKYILYFVLSTFGLFLASCEPSEPAKEVLFISEAQAEELIADGELYTLNDFMHTFMDTEKAISAIKKTRTARVRRTETEYISMP